MEIVIALAPLRKHGPDQRYTEDRTLSDADAGSIIEVEKSAAVAGSVHDLTGPGYTVVNNGATLPAGVAITGGKLVYTVPA